MGEGVGPDPIPNNDVSAQDGRNTVADDVADDVATVSEHDVAAQNGQNASHNECVVEAAGGNDDVELDHADDVDSDDNFVEVMEELENVMIVNIDKRPSDNTAECKMWMLSKS